MGTRERERQRENAGARGSARCGWGLAKQTGSKDRSETHARTRACLTNPCEMFLSAILLLAADAAVDRLFRVSDSALQTPPATKVWKMRKLSMSSHVHSASARHFRVSYKATQHPRHTLPLLEPVFARDISFIRCNDTHITAVLLVGDTQAYLAERFEHGVVLTGACISDDENESEPRPEPRPFYRIALDMHFDGPRTVQWRAAPTALRSAFESLELRVQLDRKALPSLSTPQRWPLSTPQRRPHPSFIRGRKLFLDRVLPGNVRGALNDLGEGLRDAGGAMIDAAGRLVDGAVGVAGGALDGFGASAAEALRTYWGSLAEATRRIFSGFRILDIEPVSREHHLNYDPATRRALLRSLPLFHAPWARCEDCFFHAEVSAALEIAFEPGNGGPSVFHAEVGARLGGRVKVQVDAPAPTAENSMGNWHNLIPRVDLGSFNLMVGYVPVTIDLSIELNAAAWATHSLGDDVGLTAGVEASAETRLGVHWTAAEGWQKVQDVDYNASYWMPSLSPSTATAATISPNASVRAALSPEMVMLVWGTAPLEVCSAACS